MIREMILQLKTGHAHRAYFQHKFGEDILQSFAPAWEELAGAGQLRTTDDGIELTRAGLLQVDRFLPDFFEPQHRGARYT
jgi:oxygen-independent coproporphyrinogen-3 oxidase